MNDILDNDFSSEPIEEKRYTYASFWTRVGASLIDGVIFVPLIWLTFHNILSWKNYYLDLVIALGSASYKPLMEGIYGATIGKMVVKIKVLTEDFQPIDLDNSILRNIIYIGSYVVALLSSFFLFRADGFEEVTNFFDFGLFSQENDQLANLSSMISMLLLISCVMVAFDKLKQSLHDKLAKTVVVES